MVERTSAFFNLSIKYPITLSISIILNKKIKNTINLKFIPNYLPYWRILENLVRA